jgi:hypothetical protein
MIWPGIPKVNIHPHQVNTCEIIRVMNVNCGSKFFLSASFNTKSNTTRVYIAGAVNV